MEVGDRRVKRLLDEKYVKLKGVRARGQMFGADVEDATRTVFAPPGRRLQSHGHQASDTWLTLS